MHPWWLDYCWYVSIYLQNMKCNFFTLHESWKTNLFYLNFFINSSYKFLFETNGCRFCSATPSFVTKLFIKLFICFYVWFNCFFLNLFFFKVISNEGHKQLCGQIASYTGYKANCSYKCSFQKGVCFENFFELKIIETTEKESV